MFAAESPVLNQDKTVDFSPASKPVPNELGKLIIMKKEGGEGASMDITTEITIGRDKECDIRIKLNSISRQHARIYVDENGEYYFQHLSKTNPSLVNGLSVKETHHLKDGDLLTFGDRQIKFSRPSSRTLKQFSASKLLSVDKHIPSLETIDEGHTFDFSKVQSNSSSSSVSPVKLNLTSLCKAETEAVESIQEEEAVVVETEAPHSVPVAAASQVTSPTPAPVSAELKRKTSSSVNTPTRQAIKALRKSYGATPATNNSDVSGESVEAPMSSRKTPAKSPRKNSSTPQNDTQEKEEAVKEVEEEAEELNEVEEISREEKKRITAAINTPTRKAIQALRRSSTGGEADLTTCAASEEPSAQTFEPKTEMAQTEVTAFAASEITNSSSKKMKQSLSTPVKNAIKAMRKSYSAPLTAAPVPAPVTSSSEQIASRPQALKTPLKKAIQALRKTNEDTEAAAAPTIKKEEASVSSVAARSSAAINAHLLRAIQARRKSAGGAAAPMALQSDNMVPVSSSVAMNANLLKAIQSRRKSGVGASIEPLPTSVPSVPSVSGASVAMNAKLLKAIQARRKSGVSSAAGSDMTTIAAPPTQAVVHSAAAPAPLSTALLSAIQSRRRKSVAPPAKTPTKTEEGASLKRKLATPLRQAIQKLSSNQSPVASPSVSSATKSSKKQKTPVAATPIFSVSSSPSAGIISSARKSRTATPVVALTATVEDISEEAVAAAAVVEFLSDVVSASKMQMTASVMAAEMVANQMEEQLEAAESVCVARVLFELNSGKDFTETEALEEPEDLGEVVEQGNADVAEVAASTPCSPVARRGRESLLGSLQKKAFSAPSSDESSAVLIDSLSESEMALIDCYATQLEQLEVIDPEEAYALALDAYVQGIEMCHRQRSKEQQVSASTSEMEIVSATASVSDSVSASVDFSVSLRSLFSLPLSFTDATDDSRDEQLVDLYAALMSSCCSSLSPSIAYGVALDAFLADPVGFRHRVGHIPLPCDPPVATRAAAEVQQEKEEEKISIEVEAETGAVAPSPAVIMSAKKQPRKSLIEPKTEMAQTEVKKMKQSLSTPVKNAIKAMRKSYSAPLTAAPVPAPVTSSSEQIASRPQALKTPLKKAIQALRKTNENTEAAATPAPSTVIKTPAGRKRSRLSEAAAVPLPITPAAASAEREASAVTSSKKKKLAVSPSLANIKSPLSVISEAAAGAKEISEASEPEVEVKEVKTEQVDEQAVDCPAQPSETEAAPALETKSEVEEVAAAEPVKKVKKAPTTKKPAGKKAKAETEDEVIAEEKIEATEVVKDAVASPAAENQATLNETGAKEVEEKEKVVAAPVIIAVSPVKQNKTAGGKKKGKSTANTAMAEEPVVFVQSVVLPVVEEPIQTAVSAATAGGRKRKQQPKADEEEVVKKQQQMAAVPEVEEPAAPEPVKTSRRGAKATPVTSTALPTVEDTAAAVEPPVTKRSRKAMAAAPESAPAVPPAASAVAPVKKGKKAAAPVLQEDEEEALAILCDGCDKEYFVDEVGLTSVPKGDWFCVKCVEKSSKKGGKTKAAAATAEPAATKGRTRRG